jgi:hypothetical protein
VRILPFILGAGLALSACGQAASTPPGATIAGHATAGPSCPVQPMTGDACANRMVGGARIDIVDSDGRTVGHAVTARDGSYAVAVPPDRLYTVRGERVAGLISAPQPVVARAGIVGSTIRVDLVYDTGIR